MRIFIIAVFVCVVTSFVADAGATTDYRHLHIQGEVNVVINPGYTGHVFCESCPKRNRPERAEQVRRVAMQSDTNIKRVDLFENISSVSPVGISVVNVKRNAIAATQNDSVQWDKVATVYFKLNSFKINRKEMENITNIVQQHKDRKFKIEGYTCDIGSERYNDWLAKERAKQVAIEIEKLTGESPIFDGKGKCCYVSEKRAKNRRAEIYIKQ